MKTSYYQGNGFHGITNKSPNGMRGVLFIGRGGESPQAIKERIYTREDVSRLSPIIREDMPSEWLAAIGYEKPDKREAKRAEKEQREREEQRAGEEHSRKQRIIIFSIVLIVSLLHILLF